MEKSSVVFRLGTTYTFKSPSLFLLTHSRRSPPAGRAPHRPPVTSGNAREHVKLRAHLSRLSYPLPRLSYPATASFPFGLSDRHLTLLPE
eukprot:6188419-Pleurochrysis_carterae.AAC.2